MTYRLLASKLLANMPNLLDVFFWFDLTPVRLSAPFELGFFVIFAVAILAGLVFRILKKTRQDKFAKILFARAASACLWMGMAGLVWLFLAYEEIQIFGARFWFLVWLIIGLVIIVSLIRYWKIKVPQLRLLEQSKAEANRYLPRRRG